MGCLINYSRLIQISLGFYEPDLVFSEEWCQYAQEQKTDGRV